MRKLLTLLSSLVLGCATFCPLPAMALGFSAPNPKFNYTDASGKKQSVDVVDKYYPKKIVQPIARGCEDRSKIAPRRDHCRGTRPRALAFEVLAFVKKALVAAGVVKSRPQTTLAKQAGQELVNNYGFKKLPVSNPYEAPVGSVLVYDAKRAAGHVEIRTETGFVSDFRSKTPSRRPLHWRFREELG